MVDSCSDAPPVELDFSRKYTPAHARQYHHKHQDGLMRRLSHWREEAIARKALKLVGSPTLVLDLPCGAGRFWPLLCEQPSRVIFAADQSKQMLETALACQAPEVVARVKGFQTSAFTIDLEDSSVDCIFCIRLLHHFNEEAQRRALLREFYRVTRDTLIVSLWVDGNYKAMRRKRLEQRRAAQGEVGQNRFVVSKKQIEVEFKQAGFHVVKALDFLPGYSQWRTYLLRKAF